MQRSLSIRGIGTRPQINKGSQYCQYKGGVLFLPAQVIQDLVYDAVVFDTSVRRIDESLPHERSECFGYDFDRASTVTTRQRPQTSMSILKTRLRRCAQVIAA